MINTKSNNKPLWEQGNDKYSKCWEKVDRKRFVSDIFLSNINRPHPIGENQTTSQPTLITRMLETAFDKCSSCNFPQKKNVRVLDIGSGSGVVTTLLACLIGKGKNNIAIGIEKYSKLVKQSRINIGKILNKKSFAKIVIKKMDVYELFKKPKKLGLFDVIYVGAEPKTTHDINTFMNKIPELLKKDGVAIAPIHGTLWIYNNGWESLKIYTRFVPLK